MLFWGPGQKIMVGYFLTAHLRLYFPGVWYAIRSKSNFALMKKRHLSIWLNKGSFGFKLFITQTMVWLSEWQQTVQPCQLTPHVVQASSIGNNSFTAMDAALVASPPKEAETNLSLPQSPTAPYARCITPDLYVWMTGFYAS